MKNAYHGHYIVLNPTVLPKLNKFTHLVMTGWTQSHIRTGQDFSRFFRLGIVSESKRILMRRFPSTLVSSSFTGAHVPSRAYYISMLPCKDVKQDDVPVEGVQNRRTRSVLTTGDNSDTAWYPVPPMIFNPYIPLFYGFACSCKTPDPFRPQLCAAFAKRMRYFQW